MLGSPISSPNSQWKIGYHQPSASEEPEFSFGGQSQIRIFPCRLASCCVIGPWGSTGWQSHQSGDLWFAMLFSWFFLFVADFLKKSPSSDSCHVLDSHEPCVFCCPRFCWGQATNAWLWALRVPGSFERFGSPSSRTWTQRRGGRPVLWSKIFWSDFVEVILKLSLWTQEMEETQERTERMF